MRLRSGVNVGSQNRSKPLEKKHGETDKIKTPDSGDIQKLNHKDGPISRFSRLNQSGSPIHGLVVSSLKASAVVLVLMFVVCPTLLKFCPCIYNEVVFLQRLRWPPFKDVSSPVSCGVHHTRNLRLNSTDGTSLGAWHMLPSHFHAANLSDGHEFESALQHDFPVILYLHGNCGTRAGWHRVQLYKKLAKMNFHVLAFDYRGFADSTGYPSEQGVVEDSLTAYNYIRSLNPRISVYVWGHSLGTGIATRLTRHLNQEGLSVESLILEAPFNNLIDAANVYPVTKLFSLLPWHAWAVEGLRNQGLHFATDENIADVVVPTLILHAEDDIIVPYVLGQKLYESALQKKKTGAVEFVTIEGSHGYGHKHIHKHSELENIISDFTSRNKN